MPAIASGLDRCSTAVLQPVAVLETACYGFQLVQGKLLAFLSSQVFEFLPDLLGLVFILTVSLEQLSHFLNTICLFQLSNNLNG